MQAQSGFASQPSSAISASSLGSQVQSSPPSFPSSLASQSLVQPPTNSFGGASSFMQPSSSTFGQILATPHNVDTLRLLKAPPWWSNLSSPKLGLYASIATSTVLLIVLVAVLVYFLVVKSCNQMSQGSTCATKQDNATCSVVDNQCVCAATQPTCSDVVFDATTKTGKCQVNQGKLDITCPQVTFTCDDVAFGSLQGKCQANQGKLDIACPMATQDEFSPLLSNTWTSVTSDNKCQSTLQVFGDTHYCNNYKTDSNNNIQGGAFTNTTFNVDDFNYASSLLDPTQVVIDDKWKYFHNVCYSNTCIGFSVANVGPGNTNMVYYPCLQSDTSTTTNKPSNLSSTNLGTIIVNNTSTNCLPNCPK